MLKKGSVIFHIILTECTGYFNGLKQEEQRKTGAKRRAPNLNSMCLINTISKEDGPAHRVQQDATEEAGLPQLVRCL